MDGSSSGAERAGGFLARGQRGRPDGGRRESGRALVDASVGVDPVLVEPPLTPRVVAVRLADDAVRVELREGARYRDVEALLVLLPEVVDVRLCGCEM